MFYPELLVPSLYLFQYLLPSLPVFVITFFQFNQVFTIPAVRRQYCFHRAYFEALEIIYMPVNLIIY